MVKIVLIPDCSKQRIFGQGPGYEDPNDHDELRKA